MSMVEIPDLEYEKKRHAFEFCQWINHKFQEMRRLGNFDKLYFERKGKNVKKLIEEAVPLSRLALHLSTPGSEVYVTLFSGNQNYDAVVDIEGFSKHTFKVEITTTETEETTLRRQVLSRDGYVPLAGPIERTRAGIEYGYEFTDVDTNETKMIDLVFERLMTKIKSGSYDKDTAILVYLSNSLPLSIRKRAELVRRTRQYIEYEQPKVGEIYYAYSFGNIVDSAKFYES
jgi:hypothetical protein